MTESAGAGAAASEATPTNTSAGANGKTGSVPPPIPRKVGTKPAIIGAVGAVLVLAAVVLVGMKYDLRLGGDASGKSAISLVDQSDLDAASGTLTPAVAGGLIDDAKHCSVPLASLTIAKGTAQAGSSIRIRSGNYVSPWFNIADSMQRVAIPYPSAYGSGSGILVVEGDAAGVVVGLTPAKVMLDLPTAQSVPVVWRTDSPC